MRGIEHAIDDRHCSTNVITEGVAFALGGSALECNAEPGWT